MRFRDTENPEMIHYEQPKDDISDIELVEGRLEGLKILLATPDNQKTMTNAELQYAINEIQIILDCMRITASHSPAPDDKAQLGYWKGKEDGAANERERLLDTIIKWKRKNCFWILVDTITGQKRYHFDPALFEEFVGSLREGTYKDKGE